MRPRGWLPVPAWSVMALCVAGCTIGNANTGRLVDEPGGVRIRLTWSPGYAQEAFHHSGKLEFFGEVLAMQEEGILLWRDVSLTPLPTDVESPLMLVTFPVLEAAAIRIGRPERFDRRVGKTLRLDDPDDREFLEGWGRYPGPLDPETVRALIEAHQVGHVSVLTPDGIRTRGPEGSPPDTANPAVRQAFLSEAHAAAERLSDLSAAIARGYRRLGPDFPGMGEHWIHPRRLVTGRVVASEPPVLTYTRIGDEKVLTGVAYAVPLAAGQAPPSTPLGPGIWHDHASSLDEEVLLLDSPASHAAGGENAARVAMFHVWIRPENPAGLVAQNNWALPFARLGLPVPDPLDPRTARAASLVGEGREYYTTLIRRAAGADGPDGERIEIAVSAASDRVAALVSGRTALGEEDCRRLAETWTGLWTRLQGELSAASWERLEPAVRVWAGAEESHH